MRELLKDRVSEDLVLQLASKFYNEYSEFNVKEFVSDVIDENWNDTQLKNRIEKIAININKQLNMNYMNQIHILNTVLATYSLEFNSFILLVFPNFVEIFGQDEKNWDISVSAMEKYTEYSTSEFAVRPFLINDIDKMLNKMITWSKSDNEHIRRLASEGSRPMLPWGIRLHSIMKNPKLIMPILDNLKNDPSLYVRKSVSNSINDISKTHPEFVIDLCKKWIGKTNNTDWIIKNGCRTLLKTGNKEALDLFGLSSEKFFTINNFTVKNYECYIGDSVEFKFDVSTNKNLKIRIEYLIEFMKSNNKHSSKIFHLFEGFIDESKTKKINKIHSLKDLTTRKHYPGKHIIWLVINGIKYNSAEFKILPST